MNAKKTSFFMTIGAAILATSSAVGLGNLWKFPTVVGENGGAAFLVVYLLSVIFLALPVMIAEFFIGHKAKAGSVESFKILAPRKKWFLIGHIGVITGLLIIAFYSDVLGWLITYFIKALNGSGITSDIAVASANFNAVVSSPWSNRGYQMVALLLVGCILGFGVKKGISKVVSIFLPLLSIILVILAINGLTLENANEGLRFLFQPDFSKLTMHVILMAMGLAFFKLSIGMAVMQTYASYFPEKISLTGTALKVAISDVMISLIAGIAIFPAVFSYGMEPNSGPGLIFETMSVIFSKMPNGQLFLAIFFLAAIMAAIGALLSLCEGTISYLEKSWNFSRRKAVRCAIGVLMAFGSLASLSMTPVLGEIKVFGKNFFDLFDYLSSNILLPIGGLCIAIFVGWFVKKEVIKEHFLRSGTTNEKVIEVWYGVLKYLTPVLMFIVFLTSLGLIK
jgi:NSS family neurotransmitter:Na+ symporter